MAAIVCKSKGAATAALETIAGIMPEGTQRDSLLAIKVWIERNTSQEYGSGALEAKLKMIFEGSEWEKKGKAWLDREMEDPRYPESGGKLAPDGHHRRHKMINEPEDGAEQDCFWNAGTKAWEPIGYYWPVCLHKTERKLGDEG
jgi:hypothetical protein